MKKKQIEYSKELKKYIKYNLQEPKIARKVIIKIRKEIDKLKDNPQRYAITDDKFIKQFKIRKLIVDNKVNNDIEIVRIMYARRNWINLL